MDNIKFGVPNDINIVINTKEKGVLLDENCCTCINILLTNEGKISTSFLGTHNPFIVTQLEKAQKEYFKVLKKTLKQDYKEYAESPDFNCECEDDDCDCHSHSHHDCGCGEEHKEKDKCSCGDEHCDCDDDCDCGCQDGEPCTCGGECKEETKKETKKK